MFACEQIEHGRIEYCQHELAQVLPDHHGAQLGQHDRVEQPAETDAERDADEHDCVDDLRRHGRRVVPNPTATG